MPKTLVKNLAKNLVKNLAKNPNELEMSTPQIWSKTWFPGRIRNELWVLETTFKKSLVHFGRWIDNLKGLQMVSLTTSDGFSPLILSHCFSQNLSQAPTDSPEHPQHDLLVFQKQIAK